MRKFLTWVLIIAVVVWVVTSPAKAAAVIDAVTTAFTTIVGSFG